MNTKEILDDLNLLTKDINHIILEYGIGWTSSHQWKTSAVPVGLTSIGNNLVVCFPYCDSILIYTLQGVFNSYIKRSRRRKTKKKNLL